MTDDRPGPLRRAIRWSLWLTARKNVGCPGESECTLFTMGKGGYEHCTGCPKYLKAGVSLGDVRVDPLFVVRLQHLVRLEAMNNVGCTFGPNDLSPYEWDELIVLAQERQRMDEAVRKHRDKSRSADQTVATARKDTGVPAPGASLFSVKKAGRP